MLVDPSQYLQSLNYVFISPLSYENLGINGVGVCNLR